jgi:hypothetical protein
VYYVRLVTQACWEWGRNGQRFYGTACLHFHGHRLSPTANDDKYKIPLRKDISHTSSSTQQVERTLCDTSIQRRLLMKMMYINANDVPWCRPCTVLKPSWWKEFQRAVRISWHQRIRIYLHFLLHWFEQSTEYNVRFTIRNPIYTPKEGRMWYNINLLLVRWPESLVNQHRQ